MIQKIWWSLNENSSRFSDLEIFSTHILASVEADVTIRNDWLKFRYQSSDPYLFELGDLFLWEHGEDIGARALGGLAATTGGLPVTTGSWCCGRGFFGGGGTFFLGALLLLDLLFLVRLGKEIDYESLWNTIACPSVFSTIPWELWTFDTPFIFALVLLELDIM